MVNEPPPANSTVMPAPRKKLDSEFNDEENKLEMADTQAEIILSQGLPRHIFNILNQTSTAKEIWDNVEMLMQGSGRTLQTKEGRLFVEYERFRAIGSRSPFMTTFATWISQTTPYVQDLYSSQSLRPHAKKDSKETGQSTSNVESTGLYCQSLKWFPKQFPPNQLTSSGPSSTQGLIATVLRWRRILKRTKRSKKTIKIQQENGEKTIGDKSRGRNLQRSQPDQPDTAE
ncbi:hypothetical protein Tco_0290193 [Tanacetum coccineum]